MPQIIKYEDGKYRKIELCDNCRLNEIDDLTASEFDLILPKYDGEPERIKLRLCGYCFRTATLLDMALREEDD